MIDCPTKAKEGELIEVKISIGKEIAYPNTMEHFIAWMNLFFTPTGVKNVYKLRSFTFNSHGASVNGPNAGTVYTHHTASTFFKTNNSGTLYAVSYCNIYGFWQSPKEITIQ
jgi:superoxide reductase